MAALGQFRSVSVGAGSGLYENPLTPRFLQSVVLSGVILTEVANSAVTNDHVS
jgi:hypothetical protein